MERELVLVSSCLAGVPCRYDGRARSDPSVVAAVQVGRALPACAEQLGGLPTPRPPAELAGGGGQDVLAGTARIVTNEGKDVTEPFVAEAQAVAQLAAQNGVTHAILQARSLSCGCGTIYDDTHNGKLVDGDGIVAAVLKRKGITITAIRGVHSPSAAPAPSSVRDDG
ncbi:MAG: DUF523 domain-containing protein [Microbacterium sp.]